MKKMNKIQTLYLYVRILTDKTMIILEIFRLYFTISLSQKPFLYLFLLSALMDVKCNAKGCEVETSQNKNAAVWKQDQVCRVHFWKASKMK